MTTECHPIEGRGGGEMPVECPHCGRYWPMGHGGWRCPSCGKGMQGG